MLISVLKLTKDGAVLTKTLNKDARLVSSFASKLLKRMENEQLINIENGRIVADSQSRVKIAVKALRLGADVERVSDLLRWQEFEEIAVIALERNGYTVSKNVHFKHENHRFEIDVVGYKKPLVLCIDCKHWHHGMHPSTLGKMAESQVMRVKAFADTLQSTPMKLECIKWAKATLFPILLSLIPASSKFYDNVPVVPVFQLQDFINQLPAYVDSLKHFSVRFSHL